MSDFEIAVLTNEFLNSLQGRIDAYLAGLFAMLVTSYFVAAKLNRIMAGLVVSLFSLYCFILGYAAFTSIWRVTVLARNYVSTANEAFPWILDLPGFNPTVAIPILLFGAYGGAIWFFFYARKNPFEPSALTISPERE